MIYDVTKTQEINADPSAFDSDAELVEHLETVAEAGEWNVEVYCVEERRIL